VSEAKSEFLKELPSRGWSAPGNAGETAPSGEIADRQSFCVK